MLACLLSLLLCASAIGQPQANDARVFVSPDGNDAWSGTVRTPNAAKTDGPLASLQRARDVARQLKHDRPVRVILRGGMYYVPETLVLGPEDSGTEACPISYEAAEGEAVTLSGGRPVTGWKTDDGRTYYADITAARNGAWRFRQLYVDGRREPRARYPNFEPDDVLRKGWLYAAPAEDLGIILAGIAKQGDFIEYAFQAPATVTYDLWIAYATIGNDAQRGLLLTVDGQEVPLSTMPASGGWRKTTWSKVAAVALSAGAHRLRVEGRLPTELRVHFDAFVLTDRADLAPSEYALPDPLPTEHRVVIQAESEHQRVGGQSGIEVGLRTFICDGKPTADSRNVIRVRPGAIRDAWLRAPDAEVDIFAAWGWFNEIARIKSIDPVANTITVEGRECQQAIWAGNRFYVSNVLAELDSPGEWYLDSQAGRLYYMPRGRDPNALTIVAPTMATILALKADVETEQRVRYITFRRFRFTDTDYTPDHTSVRTAQDATVLLENACDCAIEGCTFTNTGDSAIRLHLDSRRNCITGNGISHAGGNGVLLTAARIDRGIPFVEGEAAAKVAPIENTIAENHIHHCGEVHKYVAGIHLDSRPQSMAQAPGNLVSHNLIHDMPRNGIFAFNHQGGNTFEYNLVHHVMLESDDGGGIHICQDTMQTAPTVIRNNVFHDVFGARVAEDGSVQRRLGFGIYLDCTTSNCEVTSNLVYRTSWGNVFIHSGSNNVIENNILVDDAVRNLFVSVYEPNSGNRFERNVCVSRLEGTETFGLNQITDETLAECDHNLYWRTVGDLVFGTFGLLAQWQLKGFDAHSQVADPEFVDAGNDDFRLKETSPAFALGFEPFDPREAGLE
jgi:hypothetical protein